MEASVSLKKIGKNIEKESILAGLSFGIERGAITSILGPNDSGKSFFLDCIDKWANDQGASGLASFTI